MDIQTPLPYIQPTNTWTDQTWSFSETFTNATRLQGIGITVAPTNLCESSTTELDAFLHPTTLPPLSPLALGRNPRRMTKCFTPKVWLNFEPQVKKHLWGPRRCRSYRQIYRHLSSENYIFTSATTLIPLTFPPEEGEPRPPSIIAGGLDQPLTGSFPLPALCALFLEIVFTVFALLRYTAKTLWAIVIALFISLCFNCTQIIIIFCLLIAFTLLFFSKWTCWNEQLLYDVCVRQPTSIVFKSLAPLSPF